jgi:dTMP kinase
VANQKGGLFTVFEGIDCAGTSTQLQRLFEHLEELNKYQDVLKTHEPWKNEEIKKILREDKDAFADPVETANLFVDDRARHTHVLIRPSLKAEAVVLCDRYTMSTCAYQWAQGMRHEELIEMHRNRGILTPDLTVFVSIPKNIAEGRHKKRGMAREKFEGNPEFTNKLINAYDSLVSMAQVDQSIFGRVVTIDGNQSRKSVSGEINKHFDRIYESWKSGEYQSQFSKQNP